MGIVQTGNADPPRPAWPDLGYPKRSSGSILVATFCAPAIDSSVIDGSAGLPAPGALVLPVTETLLKLPE